MKKKRTKIPADISAIVLFDSDMTCCVCMEAGKTPQIHHMDENPDNNDYGNLAVLCLECHNKTQIRGGFGRHLNEDVVKLYRENWLDKVKKRRGQLLKASSQATFTDDNSTETEKDEKAKALLKFLAEKKDEAKKELFASKGKDGDLARRLMELPSRLRILYEKSRPEWDSGVTSRMVKANYEVVNGIEEMMLELTAFFPAGLLSGREGEDYIKRRVKNFFEWRRACEDGIISMWRGTMMNVQITGAVIKDTEDMAEAMVSSLSEALYGFDLIEWKKMWKDEK